jgi:hypothetical protein
MAISAPTSGDPVAKKNVNLLHDWRLKPAVTPDGLKGFGSLRR